MVDPVPIIKISLGSWHPVFEWNYLCIEEKEKRKKGLLPDNILQPKAQQNCEMFG